MSEAVTGSACALGEHAAAFLTELKQVGRIRVSPNNSHEVAAMIGSSSDQIGAAIQELVRRGYATSSKYGSPDAPTHVSCHVWITAQGKAWNDPNARALWWRNAFTALWSAHAEPKRRQ